MLFSSGGCSSPGGPAADEPERVLVQHVLVSFTGKLPGKSIRRSEEEARRLALEILERAGSGEDFDALVKEHTDDSHPGIYSMANRGVDPQGENEYRREDMVPSFGDVAFGLAPGGFGLCEFDAMKSPFGFHIIKRLQ
jgi:parvulin-like peptidyl-prolyl isomerase